MPAIDRMIILMKENFGEISCTVANKNPNPRPERGMRNNGLLPGNQMTPMHQDNNVKSPPRTMGNRMACSRFCWSLLESMAGLVFTGKTNPARFLNHRAKDLRS